jgi:hypothetical protein
MMAAHRQKAPSTMSKKSSRIRLIDRIIVLPTTKSGSSEFRGGAPKLTQVINLG